MNRQLGNGRKVTQLFEMGWPFAIGRCVFNVVLRSTSYVEGLYRDSDH